VGVCIVFTVVGMSSGVTTADVVDVVEVDEDNFC
jgi:hypothetical protein